MLALSALLNAAQPPTISQDFGIVTVNGSSPGTATITYQASGLSQNPVFRLQYGSEFSVATTTCTGTATITCTLQANFSPKFPGLRQDAIRVSDTNGNLLETIFLHGIGSGPQALLGPGLISTLAGTGVSANTGDNGPATSATFGNPQGLAVDNLGNLYIADSLEHVVRKVDATTKIITRVAGNGIASYSGDNAPATNATLNTPSGITVDAAGNLYIADSGNNRVRKVDAVSGLITTVAGPGSGSLADGGPAVSATLSNPSDVALDSAGNLYIADTYNNRIRKVDLSGTITTVAGGGTPTAGTDGLGNGGLATNARLNCPYGITFDSSGNLYIADSCNQLIREVNNGIISVVAGNGNPTYSGDGSAAINASLNAPRAVRIDPAGSLYIADTNNMVIREVNGAGVISTIAGLTAGVQMDQPSALALDSKGNIYLADTGNSIVRSITPWTGSLNFPSTQIGQVSIPQTLSILNIGNQALNLTAFALTANFVPQSSGVTDCSAASSIAPTLACTLAIAFAPQSAGAQNGSFTFATNSGSNRTVSLTGLGTGTAGSDPVVSATTLTFNSQTIGITSAAQVITLTNPGSSPLNITEQLSGTDIGDFKLSQDICYPILNAHSSCTLSITFTPSLKTAATRSAMLRLTESGNSSFTQTIFLGGTVSVPQPVVSPTTLSFSNQGPGSLPMTQTVTLSNPSFLPLYIVGNSLSGSSDFSQTSTCGSILPANSSCTVSITFTPTVTGIENAALTFVDVIGSVYSQSVALSTINPVMSLTGNTADLGMQTRRTTSLPIPIQFQNLGTSAVSINSITFAGTNASEFHQVNDCGSTLPSGQGCMVWVTYSPTGNSPATSTANLVITDNAPGSPRSIAISGTPTGFSQAVIAVDTPSSGSTVSGTIPVNGWAINDNATITAVSIAVDGVTSQATYGTNRSDVCAVYPDRAGCPNVGWSSSLVTTRLADGLHQLTVTTYSTQGNTTTSLPFTVSNQTSVKNSTIVDVDQPNSLTPPLTGTVSFSGWAIDNNVPIQGVNLSIDGVLFKSATYGSSRPDVCKAYAGRAGCPNGNVGWSAMIDTTQLTDGIHRLGVTAQTTNSTYSTSTAAFRTANGSASPIIGVIDYPGSTSVSGTINANGWAIDPKATISSVTMMIDGVFQSIASFTSRPDVCQAFSYPPGCPNAGWSDSIDTTQFADGIHTLALVITSSDSHYSTVTRQFTIANLKNPSSSTINAYIDMPNGNPGALSGQVTVSGWAVDQVTAISGVQLAVDGVPFSTVRTQSSRPDVCPAFPAAVNCPNIGWQGVLDTTRLSDGQHTFEIIATSQQGRRIIRTVAFTSSNSRLWSSRGQTVSIDTPTGVNPVSGQITVSGWAVNKVDAVQSISIAIDGVTIGGARYGDPRPDVCLYDQILHNCPNAGWTYTLDTTLLTNGLHVLQVLESAEHGNFVTTRNITIANIANSKKLSIDVPSANGQYNGIVQFSGWAIDDAEFIASVYVSIDGLPVGQAIYGSSRPDVCAIFPKHEGCPNVGWTFALDTTQFVNGNHILGITGSSPTSSAFTISAPLTLKN